MEQVSVDISEDGFLVNIYDYESDSINQEEITRSSWNLWNRR